MTFMEMMEVSHGISQLMISADLLLSEDCNDIEKYGEKTVFGSACLAYLVRQSPGSVDGVAVEIRILDIQRRWKTLLESEGWIFECSVPDDNLDEYVSANPVIVPLPPINSHDWSEWESNVNKVFISKLERLCAALNAHGVKVRIKC